MPNIIEAIGYSIERVHSGMIAYLCELHNEGTTEPLNSFLTGLDIKLNLPQQLSYLFEWNKLDFAIFDKETDPNHPIPLIMIEMKVDSREHQTKFKTDTIKTQVPQTEAYSHFANGCQNMLFVTLGIGEYSTPPGMNIARTTIAVEPPFRHVKLKGFSNAVSSIQYKDRIIDDWKQSLRHEIARREKVRKHVNVDDKVVSEEVQYRKGQWNAILLNEIKQRVTQLCPPKFDCAGFCVYLHGTRPDTILNFGIPTIDGNEDLKHIYLEVNYTGKLSLKTSLKGLTTQPERRERVDLLRNVFESTTGNKVNSKELGNSKTIYQFDIGLDRSKTNHQNLYPIVDLESTAKRVVQVMESIIGAAKK